MHKITVGRVPIAIARMFVDQDYRPILKQVKKLRLLNIEDVETLRPELLDELYTRVDGNPYQELIEIRDKGERVFLKMRENEAILKDLLLVVNDGSELNIIEIKGKITEHEIERLIQKLNDDQFALAIN